MARIKRYCTAFRRYNRSKGFGIHSPFAFNFVLKVLRERLPYYAYDDIEYRRQTAKKLAASVSRHPRVISSKNAKMVFRITNYFNPRVIMQIGTSYGVSTTAMLDVDSRSTLVLYPAGNPHDDIYAEIVSAHAGRITRRDTLRGAMELYGKLRGDQRPFILVNVLPGSDIDGAAACLSQALESDGVVILRNLTRSEPMKRLYETLDRRMAAGMGFTNGKLAVLVGLGYLPRQNFSLWF